MEHFKLGPKLSSPTQNLFSLVFDFYVNLKAHIPADLPDRRVATVYNNFLWRALQDMDWLYSSHGLVQLRPKRRPEFEKHALLTIKKVLYKRFKSKRVSKETALERLQTYTGLQKSDQVFRRLFGSESKKGITTACVRDVLRHPVLFDLIFDNAFVTLLYEQMRSDTKQDICTNLLKIGRAHV